MGCEHRSSVLGSRGCREIKIPALWIWVSKERIFYGWIREQQQTVDTYFFQKTKLKKKVGSLLFSSMHVVDICTEKQNNKSHKTFREYDKILNETVLKNISRKLVSMSLSLSKCSNNPIEIGQNMANCWNGWTLFFPLTSSCGGEFLCVHSKFGAFYLHRATFYRAQNPRD